MAKTTGGTTTTHTVTGPGPGPGESNKRASRRPDEPMPVDETPPGDEPVTPATPAEVDEVDVPAPRTRKPRPAARPTRTRPRKVGKHRK